MAGCVFENDGQSQSSFKIPQEDKLKKSEVIKTNRSIWFLENIINV